jgi:tetratricopeptide (TPR) repeat protein
MNARVLPTLVGRSDVLAELRQLLCTPTSQDVAIILLTGEEGIGKSSVLRAAMRDARDEGFMVLEGRPQAGELPQPFFLLDELLKSLAAQREENSTQEELSNLPVMGFVRPGGREVGSLPMGLLPFSMSIESTEEREQRLLAALSARETNREEEKQELFDKLVDHMEEVAAEKKIVIAIDDVHYADPASMDFLGYLSRRTRGKNTKIVATCRTEAEVPKLVRNILNDMSIAGLLHRVEVKRLNEDESKELLTLLSRGREIPETTASKWLTTSLGNPLALIRLFRGSMTSGDISREGLASAGAAVVESSAEERNVLLHASVLGKSFRFHSLFQAAGGDEEKIAAIVDSLVMQGTLKELGNETYEFANERLWRDVYNSMTESRRRILHRKAAEAYERLYPDPPPDIIPTMGRHFYLGEIHDKSLLYNRYAATLAMNAFSPDAAIIYLEIALEELAALPGDHMVEEADVLKEIGDQHYAMGDAARADEFYGKSLGKLPEGELTLRALLILSRAEAAVETDKLGLTHQYCAEAMQLLERLWHKKGLALAHLTLSRAAFKEGQLDVGRREIEATLGFLDPEKDAREVAHCYIEFGKVYSIMPEPTSQARAIEYYKKAIRLLEPLHDYKELARAHVDLALSVRISDPREALKELMETRKFAEKCKDKKALGWALFNSVEILLSLGREKDAADNNAEARRVLSTLNDPLSLQQVGLNDGILAQHRGSYEESEKAYLDSLKRADELGYPQVIAEVLLNLTRMYVAWGKKDSAIKTVARLEKVGKEKIDPSDRASYEALKRKLGI